jgi:hypothetical protein
VNGLRKRVTASILILCPWAFGTAWADHDEWEEEQAAEKMVADALVVRPVGIAATVLGSVFYVISLPFSYTGGNQYDAQKALVEDPARHTFQRPLGEDF